MAITNLDQLIDATANRSKTYPLYLENIASLVAGNFISWWSAPGLPLGATPPTTAEICTNLTPGAFPIANASGGMANYITMIGAAGSGSSQNDFQFHDRLAHMGGLGGQTTTPMTVNVDVSGTSNNLVNRRGDPNYSDVQWWLEWYVQTGGTNTSVTVTYTNADGVPGRTVTLSSIGGTMRFPRMIPIIGFEDEFIQSIQSVQLSAQTGAQGDFGVTATRAITSVSHGFSNALTYTDWRSTGLARVHDDACIFIVQNIGGTITGSCYGMLKVSRG